MVFALIGFYAALIPNLLAETLHRTAVAFSGTVAFKLFAVACHAQSCGYAAHGK